MAIPWKGLEMGAIAIAHISDPHFGSEKASEVWRLVTTFLVNDLKPELVLVTGDLAHTPKAEWYDTAKDALDNLQRPYLSVRATTTASNWETESNRSLSPTLLSILRGSS